ncbi:hypothetical protein H2248_005968 [Termitomyces sp. 'cryptogamus']|nr:hypothetical protein H2248_005968 [Termitomyces sp. 'cryptogamus']
MAIDNPVQLVNEFKKSGEFERLRQELLRKVMDGQGMDALTKGVSDVVRQELARDPKLSFMPSDAIYKEIMDNIDRFPVVDRVVTQSLKEPSFAEDIRGSVQKILEHREQKTLPLPDTNESPVITSATPSTNCPSMEPVSGPSVVVTPATPFPGSSNITLPPSVATREGSLDRAIEGTIETEKPMVTARNLTDSNSKLSTLTTIGTDVRMSDESQPEGATTGP